MKKYWWLWILLALTLLAGWWLLYSMLQKKQRQGHFDSLIRQAAETYCLEPALIKAVIWKESQFNASATGGSGEIGLMQLTDAAAYEWADASQITTFKPDHLYDPTTNTLAGCYYLAKMLRAFSTCDDPLPYALASYNAGKSHTLRWSEGAAATNAAQFISQISFSTTQQYVQSILRQRRRFERDFQ